MYESICASFSNHLHVDVASCYRATNCISCHYGNHSYLYSFNNVWNVTICINISMMSISKTEPLLEGLQVNDGKQHCHEWQKGKRKELCRLFFFLLLYATKRQVVGRIEVVVKEKTNAKVKAKTKARKNETSLNILFSDKNIVWKHIWYLFHWWLYNSKQTVWCARLVPIIIWLSLVTPKNQQNIFYIKYFSHVSFDA